MPFGVVANNRTCNGGRVANTLLGCQLGTVGRNHATGNKRNPGACKHALKTVMWTDANPRLGGAGLKLALVEKRVPSAGSGHASRPE